jgi:hypothetical protein
MLFVSREMVGRKRSEPIDRRALRLLSNLLEFEEEYGDLQEKPEGLSKADYALVKQYPDFLWDNFVVTARGVPNIDQIQKAFMKQYFPP